MFCKCFSICYPLDSIQLNSKISAKVERMFVCVQKNERYWTKQFPTSLVRPTILCLSMFYDTWHSIRQTGNP